MSYDDNEHWTPDDDTDALLCRVLALYLGSDYPLLHEAARAVRNALEDAALPPRSDGRLGPDSWPAAAEGIATRAIRISLPDITPSGPNMIARELRQVGTETSAHRDRYKLWCYLWGRDVCVRGAVPSGGRA